MPMEAQYRVMVLKLAAPTVCPALRGKPRFLAQRPLPSIIMPKWRGKTRGAVFSGFCFEKNTVIAPKQANGNRDKAVFSLSPSPFVPD